MYKVDWPQRGHHYDENIIQEISNLLKSGKPLTQNEYVKKFETDFSNYLNVQNSFAVMSCAHALDITALLLELEAGDEIIIPTHTYCATAIAFARKGIKIVWADIDNKTWTVNKEIIKKLITPKTKAVVVVHLYGLMCPDMNDIYDVCKKSNIFLVEDCAQSLGAQQNNKQCGTFGDFACFSFHAQKNITTLGEGGMLVVKNKSIAEKVLGLRLNGHKKFNNQIEYWLPAMTNVDEDLRNEWPIKSTMTEVQAIVGSYYIKKLDEMTSLRRARGIYARELFKKYSSVVEFQEIYEDSAHSHHLLPIKIKCKKTNRDKIIKLLSEKYGVKAIIQYRPLHSYDLFVKKGFGGGEFIESEELFNNMVSIPFSLTMTDDEFKYVLECTRETIINA